MLTLTLAELREMRPCNLESREKLFGADSALTIPQAFERGATIRDLLWVAGKLGMRAHIAKFAYECAHRVESASNDPRVAACNAATLAYLSDPTDANLVELRAKRRAAYAAYAADAAYAAASYAAASYAAAYAASYAGAAAAAAADAGQIEVAAQQALFIEIFNGQSPYPGIK